MSTDSGEGVLQYRRALEALRQREQQLSSIYNTVGDVIFLLGVHPGPRYQFVSVNQSFLTVTGLSGEQVVGRYVDQVIPEPSLSLVLGKYREAIDSRAIVKWEETSTYPTGHLTGEVSVTAVFDEGGACTHLVGSVHDVTDRKRAEDALRFLGDASRLLAESMDYATTLAQVARLAVPILADWCVVDVLEPDATICRVATAHAAPSKHALLEELTQRYPLRIGSSQPGVLALRSGEPELLPEMTDEALRRTALDEEHARLLRALGTGTTMAIPLAARGRVMGVITFAAARARRYGAAELSLAQELARRAAVAIDNARLYRDAQQGLRAREEFISVASHELNTPTTSLKLTVQRLRRGGLSPEAADRALELVERQTGKLTQLIDELLNLSRVQSGSLHLDLERVDLAQVACDAVDRFKDDAARAGSSLTLSVQTPAYGRWDRMRLEQVASNLLSNAVKFGAGRPIAVSVSEAQGVATLSVQDHGIGIPAESVPHIFERFERAVSPRNYGGLGLGLYIVREIVSQLGGAVHVESEVGAGSTFTVRLPLAGPKPEPS